MEKQGKALLDLWRMFLRQFWVLALLSALGGLATMVVAFILPPIYESQARILVESQQIPDDLARSTVTTGAAERLSLIQQRLMTRDTLLKVIEEQELYVGRTDMTLSEKIQALRTATTIRPISLSRNTRMRRGQQMSISAFTIAVRFEDPQKASNIANEFVTQVLDQNARGRAERATETLEYFDAELTELEQKLLQKEAEITTFKNANEDALPNSLESRRSELANMSTREFDMEQRLLQLEEQRSNLELQRAQMDRPLGPGSPDSQLSAEERQLRQLQTALAQKRAIFADSHREVRALQAQIDALNASLAVASPDDGADEAERGGQVAVARAALENRLGLIETQIQLVESQMADLDRRREALTESIQRTPAVEMQLGSLMRQRLDLREQYDQSVAKRAVAETGQKLEINQQAERFEVIENALVADRPVAPDRRRIMIAGLGVSVAFAFAIAFLREILNPAMRTAAAMERALDLRPVATIPYIRTRRERRMRTMRISILVMIFVIGAPLALYMVDTYYLPLRLLAERFIDQAGLEEAVRIIRGIL